MDYLQKNQHILNCVYDSVGRDELKVFLYNDFFEIGNIIVSSAEKAVDKRLPEEYKRLVVTFYTEGIAGIMIEWLKCGIILISDKSVDKKSAQKPYIQVFA